MEMKTVMRAAVPLALGAVVLAGCGSSSSGGKGNGGGKKTIALAYQGPLSGDNAQLGINMGIDGGTPDMGSGGSSGCKCDLGARSQIPFLLVLLVAGLVPLRRYLLTRR